MARDTRKLFSTDEFLRTTADNPAAPAFGTLRNFFGATVGVDPNDWGLKLPLVGRLGFGGTGTPAR